MKKWQWMPALAPPHLPGGWKLNPLFSDLKCQDRDKGNWDKAGKGVVGDTGQQPGRKEQCSLRMYHKASPLQQLQRSPP